MLCVSWILSSRLTSIFIMKPDGSNFSSFSVNNNLGGAKSLSNRIVSTLTKESLTDVVIGLESTSIYGDNFVCFLLEDGFLAPFHPKIHVLNPKQVKKFKEAYPDLPKNDSVDAYIIADALRFGRIKNEVYLDDYHYKALQTLTRSRFFAVQNLTKEKQRFMNYLFMKCSSLVQEKVFSNTFDATALSVYEDFSSPDEFAYMDLNDLTAFIQEKGKNHFPDPEGLAKSIQAAARGSYRLPKTVNNSVNQVLSLSISSMKAIEKQIKSLDFVIAEQLAIIPNTLTSINGQASLAKYAGLAWTQSIWIF